MSAALSSSPSWSALFRPPNRNRPRENSDSPQASVAPAVKRSVSNSPFLGPPSWLFNSRLQTPVLANSVPSPQHHHVRTPFLTVALLKLHEALPDFCRILAHNPHTQETASRACSLLDRSVATSTSPASHSSGAFQENTKETKLKPQPRSRARSQSPVRRQKAKNQEANNNTVNASFFKRNKPLWSTPRGDSSTRRIHHAAGASPAAPLLQWFTSSSSSNVHKPLHHPSAVALEGEWDFLVAPFTLLTAALVFHADMQHCQDSSDAMLLLPALYQRIAADLLEVKTTLCAPLVGMQPSLPPDDNADAESSSPLRRSVNAANLLSQWLTSLAAYCTLRAQLADLQAALFLAMSSDRLAESSALVEASQLLTVLLQAATTQADNENNAVQVLYEALVEECTTWNYCLDACSAMQQCQ